MSKSIRIEAHKLKELIERLQFLEEQNSSLEVRLSLYEPKSDVIEYPQIKYEEYLSLPTSDGQSFKQLLADSENYSLLEEVKRLNNIVKDLELDKQERNQKFETKERLLQAYKSQYDTGRKELRELEAKHAEEINILKSKVLDIIKVSEDLPIDIFEEMELFLKSGLFSKLLFIGDMVSKIKNLYQTLYNAFSKIEHYEFVKEIRGKEKEKWINNKLIK